MAERTFEGRFTRVAPEVERAFVAARARGPGVPAAALEAGVSRATGYRFARKMRQQAAAAAAPTPPIPTPDELAAVEAEREASRKEKAAARSARYRDRRAERAPKPEPERRRRANLQGAFQANPVLHVHGHLDRAETREEWLIRSAREREEAAADPAKFVFQWSGVTANGSSLNYDHQDDDDCARVARRLIEWNDSMLPRDVLIEALRRNDPYRYPQPLDLDSYAVRYTPSRRAHASPSSR
jgi:transposase